MDLPKRARDDGAARAQPGGVVKRIAKKLIASGPGWRFSAPFRSVGCVVLTYHRVGEAGDPFPNLDSTEFRRQMEWLVRHCAITSPEELLDRTAAPRAKRLPVVVTFDDGTRDYFDHAYPVLKALGIPAINFLVTDFIDHPRVAWWDLLYLAVRATRQPAVRAPWHPAQEFCLSDGGAAFLRACKRHLKSIPHVEMDATLHRIWEALDVDPVRFTVSRQTMSWDEVRTARDVTLYGGHTHTHPLLSKVEPERAEEEILICRRRIEAETGVTPRTFAYPSGDFNEQVKAIVARSGFELAFSTEEGFNGRDADWLVIKRIPAARTVPELAWALTGLRPRAALRRSDRA